MSPRPPPSSKSNVPAPPEPAGPPPKPPAPPGDARRDHLADLVVLLALLGVAEHVVRGRHLLELLLGHLVARVLVGVVLLRRASCRRAVISFSVAPSRHAEHRVVVLLEPLALRSHGVATSRDLHHRRAQHPALEPVARRASTSRDDRLATFAVFVHAPPRARSGSNGSPSAGRCARARLARARRAARRTTSSTPLRTFSSASSRLAERAARTRRARGAAARPGPRSPRSSERGLLAQHPLAVVLEVGLHALRERAAQLVALACARSRRVGARLRRRQLRDGLGRRGSASGIGRDARVELGHDAIRRVCCSSRSSTISASATSSSDGADAAPAVAGAGRRPPPAAAGAAAYSRCENSWLRRDQALVGRA